MMGLDYALSLLKEGERIITSHLLMAGSLISAELPGPLLHSTDCIAVLQGTSPRKNSNKYVIVALKQNRYA